MIYFIIWLICAIVAGSVGSGKGRSGLGWTLGILLGPIGLLIIAVLPAEEGAVQARALSSEGDGKKCPYCAEIIKRDAKVCRYCGRDLVSPETPKSNIVQAIAPDSTPIAAPRNEEEAIILRERGRAGLAQYRAETENIPPSTSSGPKSVRPGFEEFGPMTDEDFNALRVWGREAFIQYRRDKAKQNPA